MSIWTRKEKKNVETTIKFEINVKLERLLAMHIISQVLYSFNIQSSSSWWGKKKNQQPNRKIDNIYAQGCHSKGNVNIKNGTQVHSY